MSLAAELWRDSADLAAACREHAFVRGLGDGTLPREAFAGYVAQDAFFLDSFARGYALALAAAPDRDGVRAFAELLAGVLGELELHAGYAAEWGIDLARVVPTAATAAYVDFLLATAALGGTGATCAAMAPCMRLYAHLGQALAPGSGPYAAWVRTYADPGFAALAARLEDLLDRYAEDGPRVRAAYRRAMELELGFFDAALRGG